MIGYQCVANVAKGFAREQDPGLFESDLTVAAAEQHPIEALLGHIHGGAGGRVVKRVDQTGPGL